MNVKYASAIFILFWNGANAFSLHAQKTRVQLVYYAQTQENDSPSMNECNNHDSDVLTSASSRRHFFAQTAGVVTATTLPGLMAANADPSIVSSIQGPIQDILAPGHWLGQLIGIDSATKQWKFPNAPSSSVVSQALVNVLTDLTPQERAALYIPNLEITRADATKVHVRTWTKNEWLDSLDVSFSVSASGGTMAKASFYATGFLPTSIPGAPLLNIGFAWFPFASPGPRGQMLQDFRLNVLERLVNERLAADTKINIRM